MKRHHSLPKGSICYCVPNGASSCATCREEREIKATALELNEENLTGLAKSFRGFWSRKNVDKIISDVVDDKEPTPEERANTYKWFTVPFTREVVRKECSDDIYRQIVDGRTKREIEDAALEKAFRYYDPVDEANQKALLDGFLNPNRVYMRRYSVATDSYSVEDVTDQYFSEEPPCHTHSKATIRNKNRS